MMFRNIAIFGVGGGKIGRRILEALVEDATFNVTVLARQSSKSQYPRSVRCIKVPDNFPEIELVQALKGQDVLISTTGFGAADLQCRLIDAAIDAGVARFIPSEWGTDNSQQKNRDLCPIFRRKGETEDYLRSKESESFSWTAVSTGIWLKWALFINLVDIDPHKHEAKYWEGGTHRFSSTMLAYCAEAVVQLLKHPEFAKNRRIFLSPLEASQQEIVAELERQQGVKYSISQVDGEKLTHEKQTKWEQQRAISVVFALVAPAVLMARFGSGFESAGKQPILEEHIEMPKLTLEEVVRETLSSEAFKSRK